MRIAHKSLIALAMAGCSLSVHAQTEPASPLFIVETLSDRDLFIYDEDWNEETISVSDFRQNFSSSEDLGADAIYLDGADEGLRVELIDEAEGVYQVILQSKGGDKYWVEMIAVDVSPDEGTRIECLASVVGTAQAAERDGTVGFGGCGDSGAGE